MGAPTVTELNSMLFGMNTEMPMSQSSSDESFCEAFDKAAKRDVSVISEDVMPKKTNTVVQSNAGKTVKDAQAAKPKANDKVDDSVTEAVGSTMTKIVNDAAEILGVSPEELAKALEELELTEDALFNPDSVNQLVMMLNGIDNPIDLLASADAWNQVVAINDLATDALTELSKQTNIPGEELLDLLQETALADGTEEAVSDKTASEIYNIPTEKSQLNNEIDKLSSNNGLDTEATMNEVSKMEQMRADEKKEDRNNSSDMNYNSQNPSVVQNQDNVSNVTPEAVPETFESHVSPQEIYDQIGDFIKTQNFEDIKQVEMQLSPATLGSIQIKISQTENGITAQLIASNEAAKAALETQLITLKENFAEANLKVNEVEVSVANQGFNENLEQEGNSERDRESLMEEQRQVTRRLNLNIFDEDYDAIDESDLTDDVKLAKEMMEANGGSVDLKA